MYFDKKIGVSIVNFNSDSKIIELVNKIHKYKCIDYIVVTDNGSDEKSWQKLNSINNIDKVHLIRSETNKGYSGGQNIGCRYLCEKIGTSYTVIISPSVDFSEDTLNNLIELLISNEDSYAVLAPVVKDSETHIARDRFAWKRMSYADMICKCSYILNKVFKPYSKVDYCLDDYSKDEIIPVETVLGSMFIINSELMKQIEYFDESFFLYYEENVLSYKINKIEYKEGIVPYLEYFTTEGFAARKNVSNINLYKYLMQSQYLYAQKYLKVSRLKLILLNVVQNLGIFEQYVLNVIRKIIKKV